MTLKIETASNGEVTVIRLIGRVESEHIEQVRACMCDYDGQLVLDLDEVELVDLAVVRFLVACEARQIGVIHCSRYIREWMMREQ
jgi:anti-anti-sigma regulatory factor